jgi:hypothetical protein
MVLSFGFLFLFKHSPLSLSIDIAGLHQAHGKIDKKQNMD